MKKLNILVSIFSVSLMLMAFIVPARASAVECKPKSSILGLPTWYKYLEGEERYVDGEVDATGQSKKTCNPIISGCSVSSSDTCAGQSGVDVSKIWLIGLAIVELLLRLGGMITIGMVIFGGFKYIVSQGSPDSTKSAKGTIINAFVGLVIIMVASISVRFLADLLQRQT